MQYRSKDLHSALRTEIVNKISANSMELVLVKLQNGKNDISYSLHANPTTFSLSGVQTTDFLSYIGFKRERCAFLASQECYCISVFENFDVQSFSQAFNEGFQSIEEAQRHLDSCGLYLDKPEGVGYHFGKTSWEKSYWEDRYYMAGDGHTAAKSEVMKTSNDDYFYYVFSFISNPMDERKGFVIHYRPKHPPFSPELKGVLSYFGLKQFNDCPMFDFEPCYWWFIRLGMSERNLIRTNADYAHRCFNAHNEHFSAGAKLLIEADATIRPFGFKLLLIDDTIVKLQQEGINKSPIQVNSKEIEFSHKRYEFDVALSFAGTERGFAETLAEILKSKGFKVFFDGFYQEQLWGKDLIVFFDNVYRKQSRFCVIFMSTEYNNRIWTIHERQSAQARALEEKGKDYILPIKVDISELPGMPPTIAYLDLIEYGIDRIGNILIDKLQNKE